jgi:hypothetical protein
MAAAALTLTLLAAGRRMTATAPHHLERPFEILAPQASLLAHDSLDPAGEPPLPDLTGCGNSPEKGGILTP